MTDHSVSSIIETNALVICASLPTLYKFLSHTVSGLKGNECGNDSHQLGGNGTANRRWLRTKRTDKNLETLGLPHSQDPSTEPERGPPCSRHSETHTMDIYPSGRSMEEVAPWIGSEDKEHLNDDSEKATVEMNRIMRTSD